MAATQETFTRDILSLFEKAKINCLLFLDLQGNITYINKGFCDNFGYAPEDLQGVNFKILFTEADQLKNKPEKEIESVLKYGHGNDNNYLVAKNGASLWVSGESLLMQHAGKSRILKLIQNIDTHKKSELDCIELNEFNENILASVEDAVFVLDKHKKLLKYNQSFTDLFNDIAKPFTYPKLVKWLKTPDPARTIENNIDKMIRSGQGFKNLILNISCFSKVSRIYIVNGSRLVQSNKVDRFLITLHDITQLKELENEREDILGFVAHELRNPLANLALATEMLENYLDKSQTDKARSILSNSKKSILLLNKMVGELNSSSKVHSGNIELNKSAFNFNDLVKEVCNTLKALHPDYTFIHNEAPALTLEADKFRLREVITNYVINAIKYSTQNKEISLFIKTKNEHLVFSVRDKGTGILKEDLPFIFNRFFRAQLTKSLEGIGLGLYFCEKIIRAHGGKVWVESEPGKGSEFYFSLPLAK